jgi:tetratricopeptide (TPR) repeat protein
MKDSLPGAAYKRGDFIGQMYEVYGVLGAGGFGIVYLVYSHETKYVYALKTFRDEYLADVHTRELFCREANVWVDLERHPYLVRAHWVDEVGGRLFIVMEFIAPDEHGLNTLEGYLRQRPPDLGQSLRWGIQFCHGMEYAYSKGIRCHRDIKPANIMIDQGKIVRITDFGLAGVLGVARAVSGIKLNTQQGAVGLSGQTMAGTGFGTPEYMPPEQFIDAASCDERSDIYSFGVVLFQMVSGGRLPYAASPRTFDAWFRVHSEAAIPVLQSPLSPIVTRCLQKGQDTRYGSFRELRANLEALLEQASGEVVVQPIPRVLESWEWSNRGKNLKVLGRLDEAERCSHKAIEIDPRNASAWGNRGNVLDRLRRYDEAIRCYDEALRLNPGDAFCWNNKGISLRSTGRYAEALACYGKALEIDPKYAVAWGNKGTCLGFLGRHEEAIRCYDSAVTLDPGLAGAWGNKGASLLSLGKYTTAIDCIDHALRFDPVNVVYWCNKATCLEELGRPDDAIACWSRAIELDPASVQARFDKGLALKRLRRYDEAISCFDKALELDQRQAPVWYTKGLCLDILGRYEEAICAFDKALGIDPQDAMAWHAKALAQEKLGRKVDAVESHRQFIELEEGTRSPPLIRPRSENEPRGDGELEGKYGSGDG